jgi:tetratricopeptide (TPR) repeat protein
LLKEKKEYLKAVNFCESGKYSLAKPLLEKLIKNNPTVSEYHRILGQIHSKEGDHEKAIDYLIDALKWDTNNSNAYIMVGNIYAKYKNDIKTATKYYNKALEINPSDFIAINNIGCNLLKHNEYEEAERYFSLANELKPEVPNNQITFDHTDLNKERITEMFNCILYIINYLKFNNPVFHLFIEDLIEICNAYQNINFGMNFFEELKNELLKKTDKQIDLVYNEKMDGYAKLEIAEYHYYDRHIIKYKKNNVHILLHELIHLKFVLDARKTCNQKLMKTNSKHYENFLKTIAPFIEKLSRKGVSDDLILKNTEKYFNELSIQIFNTPIDLFVEDYIYNNYPELRPFQFINLFEMYLEFIEIANKPSTRNNLPDIVYNNNTILNLVLIYQFKDLYGIDLLPHFNGFYYQKYIAKKLFNDWLKVSNPRKPGTEYDLVVKWSKVLKLSNYFELRDDVTISKLDQDNNVNL